MIEELIKYETALLAQKCNCTLILFGQGYLYTNDAGEEYWTQKMYLTNKEYTLTKVVDCTQSLLQRWLREIHNIRVLVNFETIDDSTTAYTFEIIVDLPEGKGRKKDTWDFYERYYSFYLNSGWYDTYEEALEAGLVEALKSISDI